MKNRLLFAALAIAAVCSGCQTLDKYTLKRYPRNHEHARTWLSDQVLPPQINISGHWNSPAWGKAFLAQNGREVNGYIGDYNVEGVVSGSKAYLLARDGNWYYYSLILEMPGESVLIGYYSRSIPFKSSNSDDVRFNRQ